MSRRNPLIDRLVAEKVMGWNEKEIIDMDDYPRIAICEAFTDTPFDFSPTTNIADAWQVVEKIIEQFGSYSLTKIKDGGHYCEVLY